MTASYTPDRGLLSTTTDANPNSVSATAPTGNATTTYLWNAKWDRVAQVTSPAPSSIVTTFQYNQNTGDRTSQQVGPSTARAVAFDYDPATRLLTTITPPSPLGTTRLDYDALGNLWHSTTSRGLVTTEIRDFLGRDSVVTSPIDDSPNTSNLRYQKFTLRSARSCTRRTGLRADEPGRRFGDRASRGE